MKQIVFGGSASVRLAGKIAELSGLETGQQEVVTFANSELKVTIQTDVTGRDVILVQSTCNPTNTNLVELLLNVDALRRQGADSITAVIPYFGYARQNMQHRAGECVSLNVVVKMLEALKVDRVITSDLHDEGSASVFGIPFENKSALPLLARSIYEQLGLMVNTESEYIVGSPDQGGIERARIFADHFYQSENKSDTIAVEKKRNLDALHESKAVEIFGEVKGKQIILVDDVSTSGKTIVHAAQMCLDNSAKSVQAVVVHPDFARGVPQYIEDSPLTKFYTTNSIEKTVEDLNGYPKIVVVDISKLFVKSDSAL